MTTSRASRRGLLPLYGIRHPAKTWDGRPIGHVEPLESERTIRVAVSRRVNLIAKQAQAREGGRGKAVRLAQASKGRR